MQLTLRDGDALDVVADLLADPPDDIARQYLEIMSHATGGDSAFLVREVQHDDSAPRSFAVLGSDGEAFHIPAAASAWLTGLVGHGIADAERNVFEDGGNARSSGGAVAAYCSRDVGLVAVVVLTPSGLMDGAARSTLLGLSRFAPAVLRHACGTAPPRQRRPSVDATRLEEFGRASPDVFWIYSADTFAAEFVSCAVETVHGRAVEHVIAEPYTADTDVVEEDRARVRGSAERALGGKLGMEVYRIRRPSDGALRWIRATDFPLRGAGGRVERVGRIARDITEGYAAAEESRQLQIELQHRVRNALGVIRGLVRRTVETSDTLEDLASHLDGRINAFARVQAALARNPSSGLDLEHLLADEILTSALQEAGRVKLNGPRILLTPKAAETLGLILHELATNAVEDGVLGMRSGQLRVTWSVRPDRDVPRLVLEWVERRQSSEPALLTAPMRRGFGAELLERTLPYELNGSATVTQQKGGLRCVLEVPLTPLVLARSA